MPLVEFGYYEWLAFSGAEKPNPDQEPLIADIVIGDWDNFGDEAVVIVDANGIEIIGTSPTYENDAYHLSCAYRTGKLVAEALLKLPECTIEDLHEFGFRYLC